MKNYHEDPRNPTCEVFEEFCGGACPCKEKKCSNCSHSSNGSCSLLYSSNPEIFMDIRSYIAQLGDYNPYPKGCRYWQGISHVSPR